MMIYPGVFLFFLKVSVFALLEGGGGGKRAKKNPKGKKTITTVTRHNSGAI